MITIETTSSKKLHNALLKHLEYYKFIKLWYAKRTYYAVLSSYQYDKHSIGIPRGNKHFKLGTILYKLGYKEGNFDSALGKLLRRANEKRCQNGRCIQQGLF